MLAVWICAGAAPPLIAQTASKITLRCDKAVSTDLLFWFAAPDGKTAPKPLPSPDAGGLILLNVPDEYDRPEASLKIVNYRDGRMASLPVKDPAGKTGSDLPSSTNLLRNADFAEDMRSWQRDFRLENDAIECKLLSDAPPIGASGKTVRFVVNKIPPPRDKWKLQFCQSGLDLKEGQAYMLRFWARADQTRPLFIQVVQDLPPAYAPVGTDASFPTTLNPEWKQYAFRFKATRPARDKQNRLTFILGQAIGTVDLASVVLRATEETSPSTIRSLSAGDFKYAQTLEVPIKYKGLRVRDMVVTLESEGRNYGPVRIYPQDYGVAHFREVPIAAKLTLTIQYGLDDKTNQYHRTQIYTRRVSSEKPFEVSELAVPADWTEVGTWKKERTP